MFAPRIRSVLFSLIALVICLPVVALILSWLEWNATSSQVLQEMAQTVLPDYAVTSLLLCLGVAAGVTVLGTSTAAAVTLFKFPGHSFFEWALLLPMAIPAYVVAYAYTDFLQFSGPLQNFIRLQTGAEGRVLPEIRSLGGAILVFSLALYPYVYLLARTALSERASQLMEAARMLGAPLHRRIMEVAIPFSTPCCCSRHCTCPDGNLGRLWRVKLFRHSTLHRWHLQSVADHGQPHRRSTVWPHCCLARSCYCCNLKK